MLVEPRAYRVLKVASMLLSIGCSYISAEQSQSPTPETTRQMYYLATDPKDDLPPVTPDPTPGQRPKVAAAHLGFRYNLVLVDDNGKTRPILPDRILRPGDCVSVELQANRSGYLYVLAKQSSGSWIPLMPSPEMPEEKNVIDPSKTVRVPRGYCFAINDPPGTETLFVVLSRDPRDFLELYEGIKQKGAGQASSRRSSTLPEQKNLSSTVEHMTEQFGTRDLSIKKMAEPVGEGEPQGAVYVVNSSDRPVSSVVAKIEIRHR